MISTFKLETEQEKRAHLEGLISIPSIAARPYEARQEYYRLDFIEHPEFGLGLVEEVLDAREVRVFFLDEIRILEHRQ